MKFCQFIFVLIILFSCKEPENMASNDDYFFGYIRNSKSNQNNLLTINTRFDECGEWGGHSEKIIIFNKNDNKNLFAKYEETNSDCTNGNLNPEIKKISESQLNETQKEEIEDYLKKLIEYKSNSFVTGNSGMSYSVISQDSTFTIYLYNNNSNCKDAFKKLKSNLKF